jgi:DNA-binding CsgD family transcriptional regulator
MCDGITVRDDGMRFELALLRARVLLRLGRGDRAIDVLRSCAFVPADPDAYVSVHMLLGMAFARLGQHERGESLLTQARDLEGEAHPTIRAELLLNRGLAKYFAGNAEEADTLLESVPPNADMISARALEYRGWIAASRGLIDKAAYWFRSAITCIRSCRWRDRFVEASVLQGLATVNSEMMTTVGWSDVESRIRSFDWNADGLGIPRFWVAVYCAMMSEALGEDLDARAWAREAERRAPNQAYRAMALCRTAALFRGIDDAEAHLEFALRAEEAYGELEPGSLGADQRRLPLFIASEFAYAGSFSDAQRLMTQYREIVVPGLPNVGGDERFRALEFLVDGRLAEGRGERPTAVHSYTKALRILRKGGYRRQAVEVALRLARLTGSVRYAEYAAPALDQVHPNYWMARELRALKSDVAPALTNRQRAILRLVAEGKTYKEIGAALGRSWKTIANSVEQLRGKFEAGTRGELVAIALRHGLVEVGDKTTRSA